MSEDSGKDKAETTNSGSDQKGSAQRARSIDRYPSLVLHSIKKVNLEVLVWGRGDLGQLANGKEGNLLVPEKLKELDRKNLVHIAGNVYNTCFITDDGEVFMSGSNDSGQLGSKTSQTQFVPVHLVALDAQSISHAVVGQLHTLAVTAQGTVVGWGAAEFGQLGLGNHLACQPTPKTLRVDKSVHFVRAAAGVAHSLALSSCGQIFSCGQGTQGALGHGNEEDQTVLVHLWRMWPIGIVQIDCGDHHSLALSVDGRVFAWGRGKYGQLGLGDYNTVNEPHCVSGLAGISVTQIACGADHSLAVTAQGKVYSWGRGTCGQTGLGATDNTCTPTQIESLQEEYIIQVSAGSSHSLALARAGSIFAFGNGELGQLGNGDVRNHLLPCRIDALPEHPPLYIVAAGDHSVAVLHQAQSTLGAMQVGPLPGQRHGQGHRALRLPNFLLLTECIRKGGFEPNEDSVVSLRQAIEDVFSSPGFLMSTFMMPEPSKAYPPAHNLDIPLIGKVYKAILQAYSYNVVPLLGSTCLKFVHYVEEYMARVGSDERERHEGEWLRAVIVLLLNPVLGEPRGSGGELVVAISGLVNKLSEGSKKVLTHWISSLPVEELGGRVLRGVQKHLSNVTEMHSAFSPLPSSKRLELQQVVQFMAILHRANVEIGEAIPFDKFYSSSVSNALDLKDEYLQWVVKGRGTASSNTGLISMCEFPFVLDPDAKSRILQGESNLQKQHQVQSSAIQALFQGVPPAYVTFLEVRIRRDHILYDSLSQIRSRRLDRKDDLKKPLKVTFISNGVEEEGQDEGGLSKEFFQLLTQELFREEYGMFVYDEETRTFWIKQQSFETMAEFELVGNILGLAIYNGVILDVHFALVMYKKLMAKIVDNIEITFQDLKDAMPELGRGLQQLLDFEGDVEETFLRTFEVEYDYFGEIKTYSLKPDGGSVPVTNANRTEYVDLYTKWALVDSVAPQFDAIAHGFLEVAGGPSMRLFRYEELELLVCGLPHLDFTALQQGAKYEGGYHADHPVIRNFWDVVLGWPLDQKKRFLAFATGCDRAPVGGLGRLTLQVHRSGVDEERLPSSHTCFNIVLLPEYATRERLAERLAFAVDNAQGFGLQ
eukprot:evm.model.scf_2796.2 EVM.evm.TU.scf_2796.2   scf_2796:5567-19194(-)